MIINRKRIVLVLIVLTTVILTPILFRVAYLERGYIGVGGEALAPIISIVALVIYYASYKTKGMKKHGKKTD